MRRAMLSNVLSNKQKKRKEKSFPSLQCVNPHAALYVIRILCQAGAALLKKSRPIFSKTGNSKVEGRTKLEPEQFAFKLS